ncbi:MAG: hypothetical protein IPG45_26505 [Deltaproteobacteria bacterium]|jgi:hypothetical protein|nr:hypothetical protein [Deltaproteobacteria bacterium]
MRLPCLVLTTSLLLSAPSLAQAHGADPVGLSLWWEDGAVRFEDGSPRTVTLYGNPERYVQELDLTANVRTDTDQGIDPLLTSGDFANLDWTGVELVDEDWRPEFTGGFTRSRFYRNAAWMERPSVFLLVPYGPRGVPVGSPILAIAGSDDRSRPSDDGFVRRFLARQVTTGCQAIGDCSNATSFLAQGLVQFRDALRPGQRAQNIPMRTTELRLYWSEDLLHPRVVPVDRQPLSATNYRYGFSTEVTVSNPPANGQFYVPGETIQIQTTYRDGAGNRLHPQGSLPTYGEFLDRTVDSGLRYYDGLRQLLTAYYALKHREGLSIVTLGGPTHRLGQSEHQVGLFDLFFNPQTITATREVDGYTGLFQLNPPIQNQAFPELWYAPVSDTVPFVLPPEVEAGTYVIAVKGRRDWGGEALNTGAVTEIQVGQVAPTAFAPITGNCGQCHQGQSSFSKVLHGISDRRACYSCHPSLAFEPDHRLDYRIHLIHSRSDRVAADVNNCALCHLTPPTGPGRGFPGIGPN